jgi:hypothetical protein
MCFLRAAVLEGIRPRTGFADDPPGYVHGSGICRAPKGAADGYVRLTEPRLLTQ